MTGEGATVVEAGRGRGFLAGLLDLYLSPSEGFALFVRRRSFGLAFALLVAINAATVGVWLQNVDRTAFVKAQLEEFGIWDKLPAERRAAAVDTAGFDRQAWLGVFLFGPIFVAAAAGLYLFLFRFFLASDVDFRQSLAVVCFTFLAVGLLKWPLGLLVLSLKGDWNIAPELAVQANLALVLDRSSVPRPLWALADSADLFSFWTLALLAAGFRAAGGHRFSTALVTVAVPWAVIVLAKVAFFALF